ncbi:MAG TPA: VTT domain-containing protein [Candidatus Acidoferrales bacterium]
MIEYLKQLFHTLYDVRSLITNGGGVLLVCGIIFVETGLFVGFFLPGDSLLVIAGLVAAHGLLNIWTLVPLAMLCAIVGDQLGYGIGRQAGQALYSRPDSMFFKRRHLERAHQFYETHGGITIIVARFMPIVRTFCPPVAGAARMSYGKYLTYDIIGGVLWVGSMTLGGFAIGKFLPNLSDSHVHYLILAIVFLSLLPGIIGALRNRRGKSATPIT